MKVIHCLNHFFPEQIGGTEVYVLSLCKALALQNISSLVLIPNYGERVNEEYWVEGIRVIKYAEPSQATRTLIMGKAIPLGLAAFLQMVVQENVSIVHFHSIGKAIGITQHHLLAVKDAGFKTVVTLHIAGNSCYSGTLMYKNERPCDGFISEKKCTACIYSIKQISSIQQQMFLPVAMGAYHLGINSTQLNFRWGTAIGFPFIIKQLKTDLNRIVEVADQIVVLTNWYKQVLILNGLPESKITRIAQALPMQRATMIVTKEPAATKLRLVFVGRIIEEKGLHLIIDAIQLLDIPTISLSIYAQQPCSDYANNLLKRTIDFPNIFWEGVLEPGTAVQHLKQFDLLCVPSIVCEMSPLVIQEAFAAGIPVIASRVYGNEEQITDGKNGWLFNFDDMEDLKNKLQMLINNHRLIEAAKKNIPRVKSFKEIANEYLSLYNEI